MQLWEITLPARDNGGTPLHMAHKNFRRFLLETFGGYTEGETARGAWRDPDTGKVYSESVIPYRIACEAEPSLDEAFRLFPDQLAIFKAKIGDAEIVNRPAV